MPLKVNMPSILRVNIIISIYFLLNIKTTTMLKILLYDYNIILIYFYILYIVLYN